MSTGNSASRLWSAAESKFLINYLELLSVKFAILSFKDLLNNKNIHIKSVNSTTVSYINKAALAHYTVIFQLTCGIPSFPII